MAMPKEKRKVDDDYGYELATIGSRALALMLDGFVLGLIASVLFSWARFLGGGVGIVVGLAYYWYFFSQHDGQTLGKMALGIRVIKLDGTPLTGVEGMIRYLGYYINSFVFSVGWIWALFDSRQQGFHDKLVNTVVVRA